PGAAAPGPLARLGVAAVLPQGAAISSRWRWELQAYDYSFRICRRAPTGALLFQGGHVCHRSSAFTLDIPYSQIRHLLVDPRSARSLIRLHLHSPVLIGKSRLESNILCSGAPADEFNDFMQKLDNVDAHRIIVNSLFFEFTVGSRSPRNVMRYQCYAGVLTRNDCCAPLVDLSHVCAVIVEPLKRRMKFSLIFVSKSRIGSLNGFRYHRYSNSSTLRVDGISQRHQARIKQWLTLSKFSIEVTDTTALQQQFRNADELCDDSSDAGEEKRP
ncbi:unnamed protein product, partial [Prorocentrum cordatum]